MIPTFKAEFRRLFSVRSTYVLLLLASALLFAIAFYFEGYKSGANTLVPNAFENLLAAYIGLGAVFVNIIGVLYVGHEYRYNTIMYTLTSNAHRSSVLLTKVLSIAVFAVVCGLLLAAFTIGCFILGIALRDASLPPQEMNFLTQFAKICFYFAAHGIIGVLVTVLVRNLIAAITFMLLFPTMIEGILSIFLKEKASYLPFTALDDIMSGGIFSPAKTITIAGIYIFALGVVAWLLFLRRDATAQ